MISYKKLFELMKKQGKNTSHIRNENIIGQETLRKLKIGTGILEEYDYKIPGTKPAKYEKRTRETSVDSKSIEALCIWLDCQPNDIMEVIPNTFENADRLCEALSDKNHQVTPDELPAKLNMQ
jgi:DNA-binding Xre family transcriptional regulator